MGRGGRGREGEGVPKRCDQDMSPSNKEVKSLAPQFPVGSNVLVM